MTHTLQLVHVGAQPALENHVKRLDGRETKKKKNTEGEERIAKGGGIRSSTMGINYLS